MGHNFTEVVETRNTSVYHTIRMSVWYGWMPVWFMLCLLIYHIKLRQKSSHEIKWLGKGFSWENKTNNKPHKLTEIESVLLC